MSRGVAVTGRAAAVRGLVVSSLINGDKPRVARLVLLPALTAAIAISHGELAVHGLHLNVERAVIPLVAVAALVLIQPTWRELRIGLPQIAFSVYLLDGLVATFVNAPVPRDSLRTLVLVAVVAIPLGLVPLLVTDRALLRYAFLLFIGVAAFQAALGIVQVLVYQGFHLNLGLQIDPDTHQSVPYGLQWEGNTFGSFVGAGLVGFAGWMLGDEERPPVAPLLAVIGVVLTIGVVLSASRGAWLAVAVGLAVVLALSWARLARMARHRLVVPGLAAGGVLLVVAALALSRGRGFGAIAHRLSPADWPIVGTADPTTLLRLNTIQQAWTTALHHPVIGWGPGTFAQELIYPGWIGNLELHAFHDTGVIGLVALMVAMIAPLVVIGVQLYRGTYLRREERAIHVSLLAMGASLLVAFQFTEATYLSYTWLVFGLAWASVLVHRASRSPSPRS